MPKKSTAHQTSATRVASSATQRASRLEGSKVRLKRYTRWSHGLMIACAALGAIATGSQTPLPQAWERNVQTLFFELRGPVVPPPDVVILAMDGDTLSQGTRIYPTDTEKYSFLEPVSTSPWKRQAYAQAIDRLMQAGARAVAVDVVFDAPSSQGTDDDAQLKAVLTKYPGRVVLASMFEDDIAREGSRTQLILPNPIFELSPTAVGFINYPIAPNGKIYSLGSLYPQLVAQTYPAGVAEQFLNHQGQVPSFAEASLRAAQVPVSATSGSDLFFYGPEETFPHIPFWQVLDPSAWKNHLEQATFKNKIVLIGPTADFFQDFHAAPFSGTFLYPHRMAGVELQATAIATLKQNRTLSHLLPNPVFQAALVFLLVLLTGYFQTRPKRPFFQCLSGISIALGWGTLAYLLFIYGRWLVPIAVPVTAIAFSSTSYLVAGSAREYLRKRQLQQTIKHYASSPLIQEIISQQDDDELQRLLLEREQEIFGKQLAGRYRVVKVLGSGGFGDTYIAEDRQRPGYPLCVVKQLCPSSDDLRLLKLARRLFAREAEVLERLGKHDQIPQLLAYFEEDTEFYLVQEYIRGHALQRELPLGRQMPEVWVISQMRGILSILEFVHDRGVIHRDIKPSNIMRRSADNKLVLIDFGAVKQLSQLSDQEEEVGVTIGIGTQGYMPNEQVGGKPRFNSDIYATGIIAIQALTGLPPVQLQKQEDPYTGELNWQQNAQVSQALADVINKMVKRDYRKRYQSVVEVLKDLEKLAYPGHLSNLATDFFVAPDLALQDESETAFSGETKPWPGALDKTSQEQIDEETVAADPAQPDSTLSNDRPDDEPG